MGTTEKMANFVVELSFEDLDYEVTERLKKRLLDSVGIAFGALGADPVACVRKTVKEESSDGPCHLWGQPRASEATASPSQTAMYNTALTRYLDFMDSYLAPHETPHPSDNVGSVIAGAEYTDCSGEDLLVGLAVAYEIQGALAWAVPVRDRGWDHVTHTIFSATAGTAKVLGLDQVKTENALGIAGTAHNALRVTRTEGINMWKGFASANTARNAVYSTLLARNGMEGPRNVFDGQKGWKQVVGGDFELELTPGERVHDVMCKKYVAETYAQSAIEAVIELVKENEIDPGRIEAIRLRTFHGAKLIIGGGEGDRHEVKTHAQADHSLPYMLAVAALDGTVREAQYEPERIRSGDVQDLLQTVNVEEDPELTARFEDGEMPADVTIETEYGEEFRIEKSAFSGHPLNPMDWPELEEKFRSVTNRRLHEHQQEDLIETIRNLEEKSANELVNYLTP